MGELMRGLIRQRFLLRQLIQRELAQRNRGTVLGMLWMWLTPLIMLALYTFVFSSVFRMRWPGLDEAGWNGYALLLFAGMVPFGLFSEVLQRAPTAVAGNPNYVKKVVFPLQLLPVVTVAAALQQMLIGVGILLGGTALVLHAVPLKVVALPLVLIPLVFLCLGLAWLLAALGVFVRDTAQVAGIVAQMLFFASPVVYAVESVPEEMRGVMLLNPLACILGSFRSILIWDRWPDWGGLAIWSGVLFLAMWACYALFVRSKEAFADVL